MDGRANLAVGLPHDNPTVSYWQDPPSDLADHRSSASLPVTADVVIVGSGITGAAVAWHLLAPYANSDENDTTGGIPPPSDPTGSEAAGSASPPSIVMLEARQACSGATGRNGGHTKAGSYRSFPDNAAALGSAAAAAQIAQLELANIRALHGFAATHNIACESCPRRTVDIVYDAAHWAATQAGVAALRSALPADDPAAVYELHTPIDVRRLFLAGGERAERVLGAVSYEAGSINAYAFATGVLRLCLAQGLNLQTHTPAVTVARSDDETDEFPWTVHTARGAVRARRVVLATNGYSAHLVPRLRGVVVPLRGEVTAQRPGRGLPKGGCLPTTYSFIYKDGYEYMIPRPEGTQFAGDIVIGGGLVKARAKGLYEYGTTDDSTLNEDISRYLGDAAARYFGAAWGEDDPDGRVRREWTGIMGYSPDGFPLVGEMPAEEGSERNKDEGLWMSCSFQGHGMVLCWMCAKALVEMMEGRDNDALRSWFPDAFRIRGERFKKKFVGRLHTTVSPSSTETAGGKERG